MATEYKTGDTWPPIEGTVTDADDNAVDISTASSVRFIAKKTGGVETITGTAENLDIGDLPTRGRWRYTWEAGDLDVAGVYQVEIEVTWQVGQIETFPDKDSRNPTFDVTPDLD